MTRPNELKLVLTAIRTEQLLVGKSNNKQELGVEAKVSGLSLARINKYLHHIPAMSSTAPDAVAKYSNIIYLSNIGDCVFLFTFPPTAHQRGAARLHPP